MIKAGITGGIGSGKTTACKIFQILGVPVFFSDSEARKLMNNDRDVRKQLIKTFGGDIYTENGLDREKMADIVFQNKNALSKINAIVHPAVRSYFHEWSQSHQNCPYVLQEAAILFESGAYKLLDKIITVYTPEDERIARVKKRDSISTEDINKRIQNQLPDEEKVNQSDFIIYNRDIDMIIPQILEIHEQLVNNHI